MTTYLSDDFNRANSTTSLGSPVTGGPYTVRVGTWGINGNQAYTSAAVGESVVTFPAAIDVDISCKFSVLGGSLVVRWIDGSNYWIITTIGGTNLACIFRRQAGVNVQIFQSGLSVVAGDIVRVIAKGRYIYLYVNNVFVGSVEDYAFPAATVTSGMRIATSIAPRLDDISAADPPTLVPGGVDGGTGMLVSMDFGPNTNSPLPSFLYRGRDTKTADDGNA